LKGIPLDVVGYLTRQALLEIAQGPHYAEGVIPDFDTADYRNLLESSPGDARHHFLPPPGADRLPMES